MQTELDKVVSAVEFYARETFLLDKDAGERALTHRLAVQFEKQFPGWEIDCEEYDRLGERTLQLAPGRSSPPTTISQNPSIPISSSTSARFPTTCWRSRSARPPIISRWRMTSTSCGR